MKKFKIKHSTWFMYEVITIFVVVAVRYVTVSP